MNGKTINGYTLQHQLGKGGMAEVWYAENMIHKSAAVKVLNEELSHNQLIVERFRNEAEIMVKLNHPNIRQVYDYGEIDGRPAIVMEYLDGGDLKDRMKQGQRFTNDELKKWWDQLVDALNYTHSQGIVHRDIKPGNIFVDNNDNIKLLDFGIAKVRESISSTQTGQKLGTLMYMSPEQVKDSKHIDYRTDVYSLAVTFVHLITGKRPYDCDTTSDFEISEQIVYQPLDLSEVPQEWRTLLATYLEKDPQKRAVLRPFEAVVGTGKGKVEDDGTCVDGMAAPEPHYVNKQVDTPSIQKPAPEPPKPQPKPESRREGPAQRPHSVASVPDKKGKKKLGLWIALGVAAAAVALLLILNPFASSSKDALFPIIEDEKWGVIDKTGNVVIKPKFDMIAFTEDRFIRVFSDGLAAAYNGDEWGYIDTKGKYVITAKYPRVGAFSEGRAFVMEDYDESKWGVIDTKGNYVVRPKFDYYLPFSEGLAAVEVDEKWGFIDKDGKYVVSPKYDNVGSFSEGLAAVKIDDEWGYINKKGDMVIRPKFNTAREFSEGLASVEDADELEEGFIDKDGKYVIHPKFYWLRDFSEGLAPAAEGFTEWGFIDKEGKFIIRAKYYDAKPFSEGLAAVSVVEDEDSPEKWGFINKKGEMVIRAKYDEVYSFWCGVALVIEFDNNKASYIDKNGKTIKSFYIE